MGPQSFHEYPADQAHDASFPLLMPSKLPTLKQSSTDAAAIALQLLVDSSPLDFTNQQAIDICEQALRSLGTPRSQLLAKEARTTGKSDREADAYDDYFSIVRVDGDDRHVFAYGLLVTFRDMLLDARHGCSLTPMEWSVVRQGFVALAGLLTFGSHPD